MRGPSYQIQWGGDGGYDELERNVSLKCSIIIAYRATTSITKQFTVCTNKQLWLWCTCVNLKFFVCTSNCASGKPSIASESSLLSFILLLPCLNCIVLFVIYIMSYSPLLHHDCFRFPGNTFYLVHWHRHELLVFDTATTSSFSLLHEGGNSMRIHVKIRTKNQCGGQTGLEWNYISVKKLQGQRSRWHL